MHTASHDTRKSRRGMTLLEVMMAVGIFSIVMGTLFGLAFAFNDTARVQEVKLYTQDDARQALEFMVKDLRQAARSSINWASLPSSTLSYRIAEDVDGNGVAVNANGNLELGSIRTLGRDTTDLNQDGKTQTQLVFTRNGTTRVLANSLSPENGPTNYGIRFEPWGTNGIRIQLQTMGTTRRGQPIRTSLSAVVFPRN